MACSSLFSPNFTAIFSSSKPTKFSQSYYQPTNLFFKPNSIIKREFPVPSVAAPFPYQPISVDYLEEEFSGRGVSFEDVAGTCVAKMALENGSTATLMLPRGLVTSYKAPMWHGGSVELLHTIVSEGEDGGAVVQGGVSMAFSCLSDGGGFWSPSNWSLLDIRGNPEESIQVELISRDTEDMVEIKNIVNLQESCLSSELVVSNFKSSPLQLTGCVISHLTVSTPEAIYAVGLEGSDFFNRSPLSPDFLIIPPDISQENMINISQLWSQMRFLSGTGVGSEEKGDELEGGLGETEEEMEGEESDNYKQLNEEMSRIYTSAPTFLTLIDRGRRNSVVAGRYGFEEVYMFSPGSSHEFYGKYSYICISPSAMLKPIILKPGEVWRGGQHLQNPNL
ncbi:hypothetical protein ACOSP7_014501 [Xanthoceras sorbifolium]|uniref:NDH-dependent cyclic electron flow 5 n=1 Tax=Xanthoceras sorbifolium TaxID=99658 RepID=A0ABQ8I4Z9_9ROSI|nr:hypothetical protein JRO89_XS04G0125000 [Xanthoceras sorbifolium]